MATATELTAVEVTYRGRPKTLYVPEPSLTQNCGVCGLTFGLLVDETGTGWFLAAHNRCPVRKVP